MTTDNDSFIPVWTDIASSLSPELINEASLRDRLRGTLYATAPYQAIIDLLLEHWLVLAVADGRVDAEERAIFKAIKTESRVDQIEWHAYLRERGLAAAERQFRRDAAAGKATTRSLDIYTALSKSCSFTVTPVRLGHDLIKHAAKESGRIKARVQRIGAWAHILGRALEAMGELDDGDGMRAAFAVVESLDDMARPFDPSEEDIETLYERFEADGWIEANSEFDNTIKQFEERIDTIEETVLSSVRSLGRTLAELKRLPITE